MKTPAISFLLFIVDMVLCHASFASEISLAWSLPTENENGTPLTDLAGCRVYYGTNSGHYAAVVEVGIVDRCTVSNLAWSTMYYFAGTAFNSNGVESTFTPEVEYMTDAAPAPKPMAAFHVLNEGEEWPVDGDGGDGL